MNVLITLGFYKRKPGLTHAEFSKHWREVHGPLICSHPELAKHLLRYVQHHIEPGQGFPGTQSLDFDGFSEVWYESAGSRQQMFSHPFFRNEVIADEHNFLDMSHTRVLMFDNQVVQMGADWSPVRH